MLRVYRRSGLRVLSVVAAAVLAAAAVLLPAGAASASTKFVQMHYVCALKTDGQLSFASKPSQCAKDQTAVKIAPGPVLACMHRNGTVYRVAAASDCAPPKGVRVLTLPPSAAPVYFCAAVGTGVLTFTRHPALCATKGAFVGVVVRVPHVAPRLGGIETSALQYDAGTPAVPVTSSLTVTAPSDTNLTKATVKVSSGFVTGEDALSFASQNGITGSYDASSGVLNLSGTSSVANYQTALRSVVYNDPNGASPTTGTRTISFQVNDGRRTRHLSNVVSRTVMVNPNSPPVAVDDSASTDKNTPIDINVLANDSDPDGDPVSVASVNTTGTKGSVSINSSGTIHYDPNGQFQNLTQGQSATDTFTYTDTDGYHPSNSATVTVTINGVNDPPVISNLESSPLSYQAKAPPVAATSTLTLSDDDDATMSGATVSITSGFDSGADTLSFANTSTIIGSYDASTGVLTLSGDDTIANYQAALRSVQFATSDGSANPAARTVSFAATDSLGATSTSTAQRVIDVSEAAQPPTAVNHSYTAVGNTALGVGTSPTAPAATVSGSLLNGDTDPNPGGTLTVTTNTSPAHGTVTVNPDGTFTYVPNAGFSGTDTFSYTIADSNHLSETATATVTITVGPVVWYVNNADAAGNGTAGSPFNTLAAANSAAGANSVVFLYQGSGPYTGGATMQSGEDLWGQPHGLSLDGYTLVAAVGSDPVITNSGGDAVDLSNGADVEDLNISNPSGDGINGQGVSGAITITGCTINGTEEDGIDIAPAAGATTTLTITNNNIQTQAPVFGIDVDPDGGTTLTGTATGTISGNTIGSASVVNSGAGIGINAQDEGSFTMTLDITNNKTFQYQNDSGINFETDMGSPALNLTITGNTVADPGSFGSWGILGDAGAQTGDAGTVCAAISGNSIAGSAAAGQGGADIELDQFDSANYQLPGYTGGPDDTSAVATFLAGNNTDNGTPSALAFEFNHSGGGFVGGPSCPTP
jgi:VCBS repeat-containing protein